MSHYCVSGTTRATACCMNTSTVAFVPKEDSKCTHSSLEIFLVIILTHTFSRRKPKRAATQGRKSQVKSVLTTRLLFYFIIFCNLMVHFVKFSRSFTTEVIKNALAFHFVKWLIIHGTRESKISGGGGGFIRLSYFMYVRCCRFALFKTFMPCFGWF